MTTTTWTTRDGQVLKIKEMSDQHLINTIRMLDRQFFQQTLNMAASMSVLQGEYALMAAESELAAMTPGKMFKAYDPMVAELEKRIGKANTSAPARTPLIHSFTTIL